MEPDDPHQDREMKAMNAALDKALSILQDAGASDVVLLCSWGTETGKTAMHTKFLGNWYATTGMMDYMVRKRHASAFLEAQSDHQGDDDGE